MNAQSKYFMVKQNTNRNCVSSSEFNKNKVGYPILKKLSNPTNDRSNNEYKNISASFNQANTNVRGESVNKMQENVNKEDTNKQKKTDSIGYRMFTGNVERVIKWNKIYENFCYYEVISPVISIQESSVKLQKIMLLKDKKGPILQVVHYVNDHINIEEFYVGQILRCVGRMVGPNTLHAVSIRAAKSDEVANLQRLCYICDHAIDRAIQTN